MTHTKQDDGVLDFDLGGEQMLTNGVGETPQISKPLADLVDSIDPTNLQAVTDRLDEIRAVVAGSEWAKIASEFEGPQDYADLIGMLQEAKAAQAA